MSAVTCDTCDGEGYTDMGRSACAMCLGACVTTPELLSVSRKLEIATERLRNIGEGREFQPAQYARAGLAEIAEVKP